ncbi:MAG: hypothetical protein GWP91_08245 [Rhodobacterales bacterium]|nr:hypothetical protein [Rhodobacterales bacterium]
MTVLLASLALGVDIDVLGVGPTSLETASAACLRDSELTASQPRSPAFADLVQALLSRTPDERMAFLGLNGSLPWPSEAVHATSIPNLPLSKSGTVAACAAVGQYWIEEGMRLRTLCVDKKECKDTMPADVWKPLHELTTTSDNETFYVGLREHEPPLGIWQDPLPFLDRGCTGPQAATDEHLWVDANDLAAGRASCLQILTLLNGAVPGFLAEGCSPSPWAKTTNDKPNIIRVQDSSLGVAVQVDPDHRNQTHLNIAAMDPNGVDCLDWGTLHRNQVHRWRSAQAEAACPDEELAIADRVALCPTHRAAELERCTNGDSGACLVSAHMTLEGLGATADIRAGVDLYDQACELDDAAGCAKVTEHADAIAGWFTEALALAAPLQEPVVEDVPADVPTELAPGIDSEDPQVDGADAEVMPDGEEEALLEPAPVLPDTAGASLLDAVSLMDQYGKRLDKPWLQERRTALLAHYLSTWKTLEAARLMDTEPAFAPEVMEATQARILEIEARRTQILEAGSAPAVNSDEVAPRAQ